MHGSSVWGRLQSRHVNNDRAGCVTTGSVSVSPSQVVKKLRCFPPENPAGCRLLQARDESLPRHRLGVTDPQSLEAHHDLSCAALAHTEEFLYRRAVEVSGCHGTQGGRGFRQADETKLVGRAWGKLLLYYTLGSARALWPAGERREGRG